jgi:hypothetical protein
MNRILVLLIAATLLLTASACSEKKLPAVAAAKSKNMLTVLRELDNTYQKKDLAGFMAQVAPLYPEREALSSSLTTVFSRFETISLNIQYTKMLIVIEEKGKVRTTFNWDGAWHKAGGDVQKDGGRVTLVFAPGDFKLLAIEGKNPFLAQPGEAPRK